MIKKSINMTSNFIIMLILFISCDVELSEDEKLNKKIPYGNYGIKISEEQVFTVDEILSSPNQYIGKNILINGQIAEVCPMRGCWINVTSQKGSTIRVKVTDGDIVFPFSSKNASVIVEGKIDKLVFTENQARNWKSHLAKEKGFNINPDSISISSSDLIEYRVLATGANIF